MKANLYQVEFRLFDKSNPEIGGMDCALNLAGHYIGNPSDAEYLCDKRGIAPELREPDDNTCSIGFCESEQKWYGWSHRAMYGFGIGSTIKPGDCGYVADTPEGLIEERANFFGDLSEQRRQQAIAECQILPDRSGIRVLHAPLLIPMASSLSDLTDAIDGEEIDLPLVDITEGSEVSVIKCGRGEWTAQTLDDARQMACDFAESVS